MDIDNKLLQRSGGQCELCGSKEQLTIYKVASQKDRQNSVIVCDKCARLIDDPKQKPDHFRALNQSVWSEVPAVQVLCFRVLKRLEDLGWAQEILSIIYLQPGAQEWVDEDKEDNLVKIKDAYGNILDNGNSVTIIKDLPVKGAGFTAKQGTRVNNIRLLDDDPAHIQGKVNGVSIYLKCEFLKKV